MNAHWWAKCQNARSGLIPLDVEEPAAAASACRSDGLWQIDRRKAIAKACFSSSVFFLVGAFLIGLSVALVDRSLYIWPRHTQESYHEIFLSSASNATVAEHLRELTKDPHLAGTLENFATADYVLNQFTKYGLSAYFSDFQVLLSYPLERNLTLLGPSGTSFEFSLREEPAEGDPKSSSKVIPAFHAYSPSGDAQGTVVYANYGRDSDFQTLRDLGVNVSGSIVLARYGQVYRGDIVENAARAGAVAVVIYSDPADYATNASQQGYYPKSVWLTPSGVQRGTVFQGNGDPLTPGWPSTTNAERLQYSRAGLPQIPSLPISAQDAKPILESLAGPEAPRTWQGGFHGMAYRVGGGPSKLKLHYLANQTVERIRNVFGVIKGSEEPDRYILLGNHRDAWTFGAVDPNSGTAALLEIAHRLGRLVRAGWKPRRTIVLCSWDAEEYGMVGSTEWVEQNIHLLGAKAIAYLNVDCAVSGPGFIAAATPQLDDLLIEVAKKIKDPDSDSGSVYDSWVSRTSKSFPNIDRLGNTGSDYVAFLHHAGVPAVDMYFGKSYPVYHSLYDNYNWMIKFGDPHFKRHVAVSSLWGLVALRLADCLILPFNYGSYATELQEYGKTVEIALVAAKAPHNVTASPLHFALNEFMQEATYVNHESKKLVSSRKDVDLLFQRRALNDRLMSVERAFLGDGLSGRTWYKHLIYGPSKNNKYGSAAYPGILDAIAEASGWNDSEKWANVQHEIWRVSRALSRATLVIRGELT